MADALLQIQEGFPEYPAIKCGLTFKPDVKATKPLFPLSQDVLRKGLEGFADILRSGLALAPARRRGGRA